VIDIRDIEKVIQLHDEIITIYGGSPGIHDLNLLKSAIEKPFTGLADGAELYPNVVIKAAILLEALINYHPFIDGNKRTGVIVTDLFLSQNGYDWSYTDQEIVEFALSIAAKKIGIEQIKQWIEGRI
jgi:death-on-curing protein